MTGARFNLRGASRALSLASIAPFWFAALGVGWIVAAHWRVAVTLGGL